MDKFYFEDIYARRTGYGSLGMTSKYFKDNYWYKQNFKGYEGLSEEICSVILKNSNINKNEYVTYEQCLINDIPGCRSYNFTSDEESVITFQRLYSLAYGGNLKNKVGSYNLLKDRVDYVINFIEEYTGVNVHDYLSNTLYFDMLTLNVDRHFGNLALIKGDGTWRTGPMFDYGASFFSLQHVFKPSMSVEDKYSIMTPQPFDNFKRQAEYFGESKIKLNYNKIEKELPDIEGINNELLELIHKQLNYCRQYFPELKPVQNKKLLFSQHKSR